MSLVMLLLLTILGISSIQTTTLQQRMARNANDANLAFQAAESALRDGEDLLETFNALTNFDGTPGNMDDGYYREADPGDTPYYLDIDWDSAAGTRTAETAITDVAEQPKYIIEYVKMVVSDADALNLDNIGQDTGSGRTQIFRITARGKGGTDTAQAMIQGTYGRRM